MGIIRKQEEWGRVIQGSRGMVWLICNLEGKLQAEKCIKDRFRSKNVKQELEYQGEERMRKGSLEIKGKRNGIVINQEGKEQAENE